METRARHILIGLFTVIVLSGVMLFVLWMHKPGADGRFRQYKVLFNEAVSGLSQGSSVQYSGIKVGEVIRLRLDQQDPGKVWAVIRVSEWTPIRQDTQARLVITNITGAAIIQLSGGNSDSPELKGVGGQLPVIIATPSPLSKLLTSGEDLMIGINEVIARSKHLLSEKNIENLSHTLDNLQQITGTVNEQREDLRTILQQVAQASKQANSALLQANKLIKNANGVLNGQGKPLLENASKAMASLERVSSVLDNAMQRNQRSLDGGLQGLNELGPALEEMRRTLGALRGMIDRLQENPANHMLGRDKPKEFTP